jgi:hypothetical protein
MRKGMMVGSGKRGYHNVIGKDPAVHSQSAKGIKQPQKCYTQMSHLEIDLISRGNNFKNIISNAPLSQLYTFRVVLDKKIRLAKQEEEYNKNQIQSNLFSSSDLAKIKRNTNYNNHTENYLFIAKKIGSPLEKDFEKMNQLLNKQGHLTGDQSQEEYKLYQKLMEELKTNYSGIYPKIYERL